MASPTKIQLSSEQQKVHDRIVEFFRSKGSTLRIGGYAGTGKTTLLGAVLESVQGEKEPLSIACCAYTGKAASVLRDKMARFGVIPDYVGTIHGMIYRPVVIAGQIVDWQRNDELEFDAVIIDEASMVNGDIWEDLLSYNVPLLAVGDHGQLPPIGGSLNLMKDPDETLTQIHRQAEGNPIIQLSRMARESGYIPPGVYGPGVVKHFSTPRSEIEIRKDFADVLFLAGYNWTRVNVNALVRNQLRRTRFLPQPQDRVVCLKNNHKAGIYNGMQGVIETISATGKHFFKARIRMDDGTVFSDSIVRQQFGAKETIREHPDLSYRDLKNLFDYGYCLTVHKAQGSEAKEVVLFEERFSTMTDDDWRRWLYTAVTRAREKLTIVGKN